ncbi:MAG: replicative DNA helicase [Chloroflexota bacterium]
MSMPPNQNLDPGAPFSQEAEEAVIGSILIDPSAYVSVTAFLHPDDFFLLRHQYIWQAFERLNQRAEPIDLITLAEELENMQVLENIGGRAYLVQLLNNTGTSVYAEVYGRLVERTSIRRKLMITADEIKKLAMDEALNIDTVVGEAESKLFTVTETQVQRDFVPMWDALSDYYDRMEYMLQNSSEAAGVPTGYRDLDALLGGFQKSDLLIFAGRPGMGKTSWLLTTAMNVARFGGRVAIFTMEMGVEQMVQRMMAMETGINVQKLRLARLNPQEAARFTEAVGRISNHRIFIDDSPAISPMEMRTKCRRLKHEYGLDLVIVDYMQLMNAGGSYENNRVQEISFISRNLKELARELNVPLISAAQLSRAVEQRQDKRPVLSDLRESGCLTGESLVYLPDCGYSVPIADLMGKTDFRVMSLNTETWKAEPAIVTNAFCTGIKPVYKLTTALGRSIRATGNHKFLTIEGWKRLDELTSDDHIAVPRSLPDQTTQTMNDAELALLGHLIGDGCVLPRHAIQYTTVEEDLAHLVADLATEVFGDEVAPRVTKEKGRNWYQVFIPTTRHITHGVRNPVSEWMDNLGIFGLRSHEKSIPQKVFEQSNEAIALFLRHLWSTDGCIRMKKTSRGYYPAVYYATSSQDLARDVQGLMLRIGINARLKVVSQGTKGRDQHHIIVTGNEDLSRFVEIGAVGSYKQKSLIDVKNYVETHASNTNRDVIPKQIWRGMVVPAMQEIGMSGRKMQAGIELAYCGTGLYKQNVSRERAAKVANVVQSDDLKNLFESDVYWDKIVSIVPDGEEPVYDLTVEPNHNFICMYIYVHNSIEQDADIVMFLYRDEVYNEATEFPNQADVIVSKHRNGPTGVVSLYFEKSLTKFMDASVHRVDLSDLE